MKRMRGTPASGLVGGTLGFFVGFAAVALFGPAARKFQELMHLTPALVGLLIAAPNLCGSLLRIPFGAWVDTTGGRRPLLVLLTTSIVGMGGLTGLFFARYPHGLTIEYYWLLFFLGVLSGCGIATFSVGIGQVSYWFPQSRQGAALGTYAGVGNLAPGLFSLLLPISLGTLGLEASYLAWLLFLIVGTGIYFFIGRNAPYFQFREQGLSREECVALGRAGGQELFPEANALESLRKAGRNWRTWALTMIYFTTFGGFLALTAWLPTYWGTFQGQTLKVAGLLTATYSLACSVVRVLGGKLSDQFGGERTLVASLLLVVCGAAVMTLAQDLPLGVAAEVLLAVGMGASNAAVFKLLPLFVTEAIGAAAGFVGGVGAFGGFAIPPLMGLLVKTHGMSGYRFGFTIFIILAVISLGLTGLLWRTQRAALPDTAAAGFLHTEGGESA